MKEKIMNFLEERTKNKVGYTTLSRNQIMEKLGIKEEEKFNEAFKELVQDNKVFFHHSTEEKINYDGSIFEAHKIKYFTNKDKSLEFKDNYEKKLEEAANKIKETEKVKGEKLSTLSDNAKLIYNTYKENLGNLAYLDSKSVREKTGLEFKDFVAAQKELSANKVLFTTKISKSNEEKFVLIDRGDILSKVLKREEIKENIKNKIKDIYHSNDGVFGHRQIKKLLKRLYNIDISKTTVHKYLNKELKLFSIVRTKKPNYKKGKPHKIFENLLNQNFFAAEPNKIWCTDFTYLKWLYNK